MTITEVRKKVKRSVSLLKEYGTIQATINACARTKNATGITVDENYLHNMEERQERILEVFNVLLK